MWLTPGRASGRKVTAPILFISFRVSVSLSSVCLLPIPLAFHYRMLNSLSDMVGGWAGLGGGEGVCGRGGVIHAVQIQPLALQ